MKSWPSRCDAVLIDVGGVLFGPDTAAVSTVLRDCGVPRSDTTVARAHYVAQAVVDASDDPGRYPVAYTAALVGEDAHAPVVLERLFVAGRPAHPWREARSAIMGLAELASRPWKLGIVSNSGGDLEERLDGSGVRRRGAGGGAPVDVIIDSGCVGVAKPDPSIFRMAVGALGVAPARAIHVGDSVRFDVEPARAAGLVGAHYDPFDACPMRAEHPHLRSLHEIATDPGAGR